MIEISYFLFSVVVISLSGVLMPGPLLAVVVKNSPRNRWAGIEAAMGHGMIELPLVIAIAFGFNYLFSSDTAQIAIGSIGGIALIVMGINALRAPLASADSSDSSKKPRSIIQGLIASLNPYFFLWWATAGAAIIMKALTWSYGVVALMFAAHILVDIVWYGAVGFGLAKSMGTRSGWQRGVLVFCGIAMISFGIYFVWSSIELIR